MRTKARYDCISFSYKGRYALLPYIYDLFVEHQNNGAPVMRPLMYNFENDKNRHHFQGKIGYYFIESKKYSQSSPNT